MWSLVRWTALVLVVAGVAIGTARSSGRAEATVAPAPTTAGTSGAVQGDVDCDSSVGVADALGILGALAGVGEATECFAAGDVQCDGDVDVVDALAVLSHSTGGAAQGASGCPAIGSSVPLSKELIADAVAAGDIDYETSLVYRAYAMFGDPRLPAAYRSELPDVHAGTALFKEIEADQDNLSADEKATLAPFVARPNDPASVFNQAQPSAADPNAATWWSLSVAGGKYRLWTNGEETAAKAILEEYEADVDEIVPELAKVVDEPLPDEPGPDLEINLDDAIDIYLFNGGGVDPRCKSLTPDGTCYFGIPGQTRDALPTYGNKSSAWVLMDRNAKGNERTHVLAHELSHASQNGYDRTETADGEWLIDATAEWGAYRVLTQLGRDTKPVTDWLHPFFKQASEVSLTEDKFMQRYRSWIYFHFLEIETGSHDVVRKIWEAASADGLQLEGAIDQLYPFEKYFPKFAEYEWNQPPVDWFALDDQILETAELYKHQPEDVALQGSAQSRKFETNGDVKWLQAHFFDFKFTDPGVRSGKFFNKVEDIQHSHVTALLKVNGDWKEQDWSDKKDFSFCRDKSSQNYEEVVIIISNDDWQREFQSLDPEEQPYLQASSVGCKGWSGTVTGETYLNGAAFNVSLTDVLFVPDPKDVDPFDDVVGLVFKSSSPITWVASGNWPNENCHISGTMALGQPGSGGEGEALGYLLFIRSTGEYSIDISGQIVEEKLLHVSCPGSQFDNIWPVVRPVVWDGGTTPNKIEDEDGHKVARGQYSDPNRLTGGIWTWDLEEVP
jgi:hypothetical protein